MQDQGFVQKEVNPQKKNCWYLNSAWPPLPSALMMEYKQRGRSSSSTGNRQVEPKGLCKPITLSKNTTKVLLGLQPSFGFPTLRASV